MEFIFPSNTFLDILNTVPSAVLILDEENDIIFVNTVVLWLYKYRSIELLGSSISLLIPKWIESDFSWEAESVDQEGGVIPVSVRSKALSIGEEKFKAVSLLDLRKQKQKEELLKHMAMEATLLHKAASLAVENIPIDLGYKKMLEYICLSMNCSIGHVYFPSIDGNNILLPSNIWYLKDEKKYKPFVDQTQLMTFGIGAGLPGLILKILRPVYIKNVQKDPAFIRKVVCNKLGIKEAFGFPVILDGKLVAVLGFYSEDPIPYTKEFLSVMENLGRQMSRVVERRLRDEELRNAQTTKSEFLSIMSHEIRTPINVISGMADLLAESSLDAIEVEYVEMLKRSSKALLTLINDILDLSKIESGEIKLEYLSFSVRKVANELISQLSAHAKQKNLHLSAIVEDSVPQVILGDPIHLHQVLVNLLGNSIKFTDQGDILLHVKNIGESLLFIIRDTGIGIAANKLESIFHPFTPVDSTTTRQHGGTGLGLTISKHLIELMGGRINVASELHVGTEFVFSIPLQAPQKGLSSHVERRGATLTKPMRILLAEDSEDNRLLMQTYFAKTPVKLDEAVDGEAAFEMFKREKYDLILLDIQMPKMDGYMTAKAIRAWEREQKIDPIPIIAITAFAQKEDAQKSYDAGCDQYMTKPIAKNDLFKAIIKYEQRL